VVVADGGAGRARECDCRRRALGSRLLEATGIPLRYQRCRFAGFKTASRDRGGKTQLVGALTLARRYVDEFIGPEGRFRESGLIFTGPPGVGKTHLAVAVLAELVERYRMHGRFVDFTSLIHQIQATFDPRSPDSKREILDPIIGAEVLVLDELGAQKPTPWVNDILYLIMNSRYTARLPTLFTTNYRLEAPAARPVSLDRGADAVPAGFELLASRISPLLLSRLFEMAQPVALDTAADFRRDVKMHQHRIEPEA
jgi:DNA replication protein DnaC